jgi:hypothetical protein
MDIEVAESIFSPICDQPDGFQSRQDITLEKITEPLLNSDDNHRKSFDSNESEFIKSLLLRIDRLEKQLAISLKSNIRLKNDLKKNMKENSQFEKNLSKFLEPDQIKALKGTSKISWSNKTISKTLFLKRRGKNLLNIVRKCFVPLPSMTTCNKRIESIKFEPGILDLPLQTLAKKCENISPANNSFFIAFDEMAIVPGMSLDPSTKKYQGSTTLPPSNELADQMLLFLVMGIGLRVKEFVAYHFTKKSITTGKVLMEFILKLIVKVETVAKIKISGISFDLSALDCSMIKEMGITFNLQNKKFSTPHPTRKDAKILLAPDGPHCSKNLNQGLKNKDIVVSKKLCEKFSLHSSRATLKDVEKLFKQDQKLNFKLMPHVNDTVVHTKHFDKMDAKNSVKFHSLDVQTAINFSTKSKNDKRNTTSFVLSCFQRFHDIISSTSGWKSNESEKFQKDIDFLLFFANDFLMEIQIGYGNKKSVFGSRMLIFSLIDLATESFSNGMTHFIPSRITTEPVENKFSIIRNLSSQISSVQCSQSLRTMFLTPYDFDPIRGVYRWDERETVKFNYLEFLLSLTKETSSTICNQLSSQISSLNDDATWSEIFENFNEFNAFVCHISKFLDKIIPKIKCDECSVWFNTREEHSLERIEGYKLLYSRISNDQENYPIIPSISGLQFFLNMESIYATLIEMKLHPLDPHFESSYHESVSASEVFLKSHCFIVLALISDEYLKFRRKISLHSRLKHKAQHMASKSLK